MSVLDGPVEIIGSAVGGVFGWTIAFILAVHIGMFIGVSVALGEVAPLGLIFIGSFLLALAGIVHLGYLLFIGLLLGGWIISLFIESGAKRLLMLIAAGGLAAAVAYDATMQIDFCC